MDRIEIKRTFTPRQAGTDFPVQPTVQGKYSSLYSAPTHLQPPSICHIILLLPLPCSFPAEQPFDWPFKRPVKRIYDMHSSVAGSGAGRGGKWTEQLKRRRIICRYYQAPIISTP